MTADFYLRIAAEVAKQSYCNRRKVGAVLVSPDSRNIIAYGFNGTISKFPNICELEDGTTDNMHVLHAETNAIMKAAKSGQSTNRSILYVTLSPCVDCAKIIIQAGIKAVIYLEQYRCTKGIELLKRANVTTNQINI